MRLSPTAAAAVIARLHSSSSRFVSTTCAAGKHRAEAHGESRHTTEDLFEVREGLRFDSRGLRTLSSSRLIEVQAPTSLDTDLDVESDSVVVPRAPTAPRRCARYGLAQGSSADAGFEICTTGRRSRLCRSLASSWRPAQDERIAATRSPESSRRSTIDFTPAGPPLAQPSTVRSLRTSTQ